MVAARHRGGNRQPKGMPSPRTKMKKRTQGASLKPSPCTSAESSFQFQSLSHLFPLHLFLRFPFLSHISRATHPLHESCKVRLHVRPLVLHRPSAEPQQMGRQRPPLRQRRREQSAKSHARLWGRHLRRVITCNGEPHEERRDE